MVGVPKRLIGLLSYLGMSSCEHQEHAKEHHMTCDATRLRIMDLYCGSGSDLTSLYVEEAVWISSAQRSNACLLTSRSVHRHGLLSKLVKSMQLVDGTIDFRPRVDPSF